MATDLYADLLAVANATIAEFGKAAVVIRKVRAGGTDQSPTFVKAEYAITVVETGYSLTNRNETIVEQGDFIGLASMDGEVDVLEKSDILVVDGKHLTILDLQPLSPGDTQLLTEIHARQ